LGRSIFALASLARAVGHSPISLARAQVTPFKDERATGTWTSTPSSITVSWDSLSRGGFELKTKFVKFKGKQKFKGVHVVNGAEVKGTAGALVIEQ
jgi:hypothetical protein